jgi:hypothetical protein
MKKAIVAIAMLAAYTAAMASCPSYAPYRCVVLMSGKQMCGCGY